MAEIQVRENWAGYPPGSVVSVSAERAGYLVTDLRVARYTPAQLALNKNAAKAKKANKGKGE